MTSAKYLVRRTPLLKIAPALYAKAENLQTSGSYKMHGIAHFLEGREEVFKKGITTVSAGNLGQSLAFAAKALGFRCKVLVPEKTSLSKKMAILSLGADLEELPFSKIWELVFSENHASNHLTHPYDFRFGYKALVDEIITDLPHAGAIVVPYGLGALAGSIAERAQELGLDLGVYACEFQGSSPVTNYLSTGRVGSFDRKKPIYMDAIGTPAVLPYAIREFLPKLAGTIIVDENETVAALKTLFKHHNLRIEGAAGAAYAGAIKLANQGVVTGPIVCLFTGGNISAVDFDQLVFGIDGNREG
mgnify:CR=1 FL=1